MMDNQYDSILFVSFGGPERSEDVMPFLRNVTKGRGIPDARLLEVAEHYYHFDGVSPINAQNRALISALEDSLKTKGPNLPIYFGNRNWDPFLKDAIQQMQNDGKKRAVAFFTSIFSSYSGCRQYRENIIVAKDEVGSSIEINKLRMGFNHPGFISATRDRLQNAMNKIAPNERGDAHILFTAHSIPIAMAEKSSYVLQLNEAIRLVLEDIECKNHSLCYQSKSGSGAIPWLEPDVNDVIRDLASKNIKNIVVMPIGFISDHMEVLYDLDCEAMETAKSCNINLVRAGTVGTHPDFVEMIRDLIVERITDSKDRKALGNLGAWHDVCPIDCCESGRPQR